MAFGLIGQRKILIYPVVVQSGPSSLQLVTIRFIGHNFQIFVVKPYPSIIIGPHHHQTFSVHIMSLGSIIVLSEGNTPESGTYISHQLLPMSPYHIHNILFIFVKYTVI